MPIVQGNACLGGFGPQYRIPCLRTSSPAAQVAQRLRASPELIMYNVPSVQQGKLFVNTDFPDWPRSRQSGPSHQLASGVQLDEAGAETTLTSSGQAAVGAGGSAKQAPSETGASSVQVGPEGEVISVSSTPYASPRECLPSRSPSPSSSHSPAQQQGSPSSTSALHPCVTSGTTSSAGAGAAFCWPLSQLAQPVVLSSTSASGLKEQPNPALPTAGVQRAGGHRAQAGPVCPFTLAGNAGNFPAFVGMHEEANARYRSYMEVRDRLCRG